MAIDTAHTLRGALAGVAAAGVWAAQQPLDKRVLGSAYDDTELLGRLITRRPLPARAIGTVLHLANGAFFGAVYANVAPRVPLPSWARGPVAGLAEGIGTWPLVMVSDRLHPARDDLPRLSGDRRALALAVWRHLLFGFVLGELERRLNAPDEAELPDYEHAASTNGHGSIEHAFAS